jgi:hypothetical protein
VADYDNDGWPDLLVTGYGRLALFHNEPDGSGGRRFVEVTARAGLTDRRAVHWSTSAAWGDFDGDGKPDLFVTHYVDWSWQNHPRCPGYRPDVSVDVCPPKRFQGLPASLFLNNGDGTFRDGSAAAGLKPGKGLGVVAADLDGDGRLDIYVANDTIDNFLYLNQGGGRFREEGVLRGVAYDDAGLPNGSMGVDAADYNGTGRLSLFVTNYQHEAHALYRNLGKGQFAHASRAAGVSAIGLTYVGFGTGFFDYDRDGWEDLVIANGHVIRYPHDLSTLTQRPVLLRNQRGQGDGPGAAVFRNVTDGGGPYFHRKHMARGLALGDLDNDGRTDVVISHVNAPVVLLRNTLDNGHHWLGIGLTGQPLRDAVGARLELEAGGRTLVRTIRGGGSYLSSGDPRVIYGLSDITKVKCLTVRWPSGRIGTWSDLPVDNYWYLTEGDPIPRTDSQRAAVSKPSAELRQRTEPGRPRP